MPRGFSYGLRFKITADTGGALSAIRTLREKLEEVTGGRGRVRGGQAVIAGEEGETAATRKTTAALKEKGQAHMNLWGIMGRGLKMYWTFVSFFYIMRNAINMVMNAYRMLWTVISRGIGLMAGLGREVIKQSGEFEKLRIVLEAISPTAEYGRKVFEDLKKFVVGMPFTLKEAADAFKFLEATGVRAAMGLERSMRVAGTMAMTMDRKIMDAALAIAKFQAGYMQRLTRGFAITPGMLIPYGAAAGDRPGTLEYKEPGAMQKNVEALYRFVEDRWGTLLERMRNSWEQLINDMTDIWQIFMASIGGAGVLEGFKGILRYVRDLYEQLRDVGVIEKWANTLAKLFDPVIEAGQFFAERLPGWIDRTIGLIDQLRGQFVDWLDSIGGVEGAWKRLVDSILQWGPGVLSVVRAYYNVVLGLGQAMMFLATGTAGFISLVNQLIGRKQQAEDWWRIGETLAQGYRTQAKALEGMNEAFEKTEALMRKMERPGKGTGALAGVGLPGYEKAATAWGGEAGVAGTMRDAMRGMAAGAEAGAEAGTESGVTKAFEKLFTKQQLAGEGDWNPLLALAKIGSQRQREQATQAAAAQARRELGLQMWPKAPEGIPSKAWPKGPPFDWPRGAYPAPKGLVPGRAPIKKGAMPAWMFEMAFDEEARVGDAKFDTVARQAAARDQLNWFARFVTGAGPPPRWFKVPPGAYEPGQKVSRFGQFLRGLHPIPARAYEVPPEAYSRPNVEVNAYIGNTKLETLSTDAVVEVERVPRSPQQNRVGMPQ